MWARIGDLVSGRLSWILALAVTMAGGALLGLVTDNGSAEQAPVVVPATAESARVTEALKAFPGGDSAPVILLVTRADGQPAKDVADLCRRPADLENLEQLAADVFGNLPGNDKSTSF
jgi:RND superfamily putative drug exporter